MRLSKSFSIRLRKANTRTDLPAKLSTSYDQTLDVTPLFSSHTQRGDAKAMVRSSDPLKADCIEIPSQLMVYFIHSYALE